MHVYENLWICVWIHLPLECSVYRLNVLITNQHAVYKRRCNPRAVAGPHSLTRIFRIKKKSPRGNGLQRDILYSQHTFAPSPDEVPRLRVWTQSIFIHTFNWTSGKSAMTIMLLLFHIFVFSQNNCTVNFSAFLFLVIESVRMVNV